MQTIFLSHIKKYICASTLHDWDWSPSFHSESELWPGSHDLTSLHTSSSIRATCEFIFSTKSSKKWARTHKTAPHLLCPSRQSFMKVFHSLQAKGVNASLLTSVCIAMAGTQISVRQQQSTIYPEGEEWGTHAGGTWQAAEWETSEPDHRWEQSTYHPNPALWWLKQLKFPPKWSAYDYIARFLHLSLNSLEARRNLIFRNKACKGDAINSGTFFLGFNSKQRGKFGSIPFSCNVSPESECTKSR